MPIDLPFNLAVSMGKIKGHSVVDKFGILRGIQAGQTPVEIWEG